MAVSVQKSIAPSHIALFEIRIGAGVQGCVEFSKPSCTQPRTPLQRRRHMKLETIETFEEFAAKRDEWNALLESSASDCVFLTHEWLSTWWKHLAQGRLRILTALDRGNLIGILPVA